MRRMSLTKEKKKGLNKTRIILYETDGIAIIFSSRILYFPFSSLSSARCTEQQIQLGTWGFWNENVRWEERKWDEKLNGSDRHAVFKYQYLHV